MKKGERSATTTRAFFSRFRSISSSSCLRCLPLQLLEASRIITVLMDRVRADKVEHDSLETRLHRKYKTMLDALRLEKQSSLLEVCLDIMWTGKNLVPIEQCGPFVDCRCSFFLSCLLSFFHSFVVLSFFLSYSSSSSSSSSSFFFFFFFLLQGMAMSSPPPASPTKVTVDKLCHSSSLRMHETERRAFMRAHSASMLAE